MPSKDLTKAIALGAMALEMLQKSHVSGYTKKDGTVVQEYEDERQSPSPSTNLDYPEMKKRLKGTLDKHEAQGFKLVDEQHFRDGIHVDASEADHHHYFLRDGSGNKAVVYHHTQRNQLHTVGETRGELPQHPTATKWLRKPEGWDELHKSGDAEPDGDSDDLHKAVAEVQNAADELLKSHVKEHTRVSTSGAFSQVSAYDDKRQAAQAATTKADATRSKVNYDKPNDLRDAADAHYAAAHAHIEALKHATTNEDINHHNHSASRHLQEADGLHSYANSQDSSEHSGMDATAHADRAEHHAKKIGKSALGEHDENTSEGLNKKTSLHLLAMEQHQRAKSHHMDAANKNYDDEETRDSHLYHAQENQDATLAHGKEVRRSTKISIDADERARAASAKADASGKPEDHKAAADARRAAAKLNYDSEGKTEHEKKSEQHEKKAKPVENDHPAIIGKATHLDDKAIDADTFRHNGKKYISTGKNGKSNHDGRPVREFCSQDRNHYTWLDHQGNVHADSKEEALAARAAAKHQSK